MSCTASFILDLRDFLKNVFAGHFLEVPLNESKFKEPNIWIGNVPPKDIKTKDGDPPFIIISVDELDKTKPMDGGIVNEIKVSFIVCIYKKDNPIEIEAGYIDVLNIIDRISLIFNEREYFSKNYWYTDNNIKWVQIGKYGNMPVDQPFYGDQGTMTFYSAGLQKTYPNTIE